MDPSRFLSSQSLTALGGSVLGTASNLKTGVDSVISDTSSLFSGATKLFQDGSPAAQLMSYPETKTAASQDKTNGGSSLQYPPDMGRYFIQFDFFKYKRPAPMDKATSEARGTITLPIPDNLAEDFAISYEDKPLGIIGNIADNMQRALPYNGAGSTSRQVEAAAYEAGIRGVDAIAGIAGNLTGLSGKTEGITLDTSSLSGVVEQSLGATPNPSLAVLFGGVGFRRHRFEWFFAPKTSSESQTIRDIIKNLKMHSLPAFSQGVTNILDYPDMVVPSLFPWASTDGTDTYAYTFKKCVIDSINFDYNPMRSPTFFTDTKAPTFIKLTMNLREIEYFTSDDFGGSGSALSVGDAFHQMTGGVRSALANAKLPGGF